MNAPRFARTRSGLALLLTAFGLALAAVPARAATGAFYTVVPPCRVYDSRNATAVAQNEERFILVVGAGSCGIPAEAQSLAFNLTVTEGTSNGHITLYPQAGAAPLASAINFRAGQTRANNVVLRIISGGFVAQPFMAASGTVHVIVDVVGYFTENVAPTDIALSGNTVAENQVSGTVVGTFSTTDIDDVTHTYSLVPGTGSTDNASFQIVGNQLQTNAVFDFEAQSSYSIRVQTDDGNGGTFEEVFTITVTNVSEAPTLDPIADPAPIPEDSGEQTVNLTGISAGGGESQPLQVTAVSDNTAVIPDPTVTYTSPNATGSLQYTPVADTSGTANITVTVTDGGLDGNLATPGDNLTTTDTFQVVVGDVNDPPTLDPIADPAPIPEDSGVQTVNLTGITAGDAESQPLQVTAVSDNTALIPHPTVIYTSPNATGSLQYTPVANASGTANVTVTVTDGGLDGNLATPGDNGTTSDTFLVTVDGANDPPTIDTIPDPAAIDEDAGMQTVNLSGISAGLGEGTQPLQVTAVSDNTAVIPDPTVIYTSPNATGSLQYTPVADAFGTANITVTVTDGGLDNNLATAGDNGTTTEVFQVVVNEFNDPPTLDPIADPPAVNEDAGLQTVNLSGITAGDAETQPLQVTAVSDNTAVIPNPSVSYSSPSTTGSLQYTPVADASGTANITVTVTDGGLDGNLATAGDNGTTTDVFQVVVNAVNDLPTLDPIADPAAINEDAGLQTVNLTGITAGDAETQPLQVTAVSDSTGVIPNPTVIYSSPSTTGSLQYTPVAGASGTASITVTVTDGGLDGNLATPGDNATTTDVFQVVVNAVNDSPTIDAIPDPAAINEDAGLQTVNLSGISAGPGEATQPLQVTALSDNTALIPNPTVIYSSPSATGSLQYTPVSNAFGTANITVTVTDGGLDNNLATAGDNGTTTDVFQVVVNAVNDPPSFNTIPDPAAINEDAPQQTVNLSGITAGPGEGTQPLQVTAVSDNTAVIPNPTVIYASPNATGSLQYTPVANAFGTANITVTLTDGGDDNNLATPGDNLTFTDIFQVVVNPVNDAPTGDPDRFDYIGNTELRVDLGAVATPHALETTPTTFGVVDGDSDPVEGDAIAVSSITVGACTDNTLPTFDCDVPTVGKVHMEPNGRFTFEPAPGDTGAPPTADCPGAVDQEMFTYILTDDGTPAPASSAPITVTLCRFARVWYVDPNAGGGGNGTSALPFNALTATNLADTSGDGDLADDLDVAGDYIFIHDGTLNGSIELEANQRLIGQGEGLLINQSLNGNPITPLVPAGTHPQLTNASGDAVTVTEAIPIEIVGLSLQGSSNAIDVTTDGPLPPGVSTLTIDNNIIRGSGAGGLDINLNVGTTNTLALNITGNSWTTTAANHAGNAVDINRAAGTLNLNFSGNTDITSSAAAINISGGAVANTTITGFAGNTVHQNTLGAGVLISNVTFDATPGGVVQQVNVDSLRIGIDGDGVTGAGMQLATVQGNLFFDDLDVYGGTSGLLVSGTGSGMAFAVTPATPDGIGTSEVKANGAAVDINTVNLDLRLSEMASTTSGAGVSLTSVGASSRFRAPSGSSISKTSGGGTAFSVASSGSGSTIEYAGTLNVTSGGGVSLSNNTGSTMSFSGGMTLSTGANAGFSATGGGTVTVTDPAGPTNNTITTAAGTALTVTSTTIGAGGLTFERISAGTSGTPTNGIVLNTTGSGGLTVTGDGGGSNNGSGGSIQNTTAEGILLNSAANVSLNYMNITNSGTDSIRITNINGFTLNRSNIDDAAGTAPADKAIDVGDFSTGTAVNGTINITNNVIGPAAGNSPHDSLAVGIGSGTSTWNVTNTTFRRTGNSGIDLELRGSAVVNAFMVDTCAFAGAGFATSARGVFANNLDDSVMTLLTVRNSSFTNNNIHIDINQQNDTDPVGSSEFAILNNTTMTGARSHAINIFSAAGAFGGGFEGTISGNVIGNSGVADSGSAIGNGIRININGGADSAILLNGNTIRQTPNGRGIEIIGRNGTGGLDVTVTNNDVNPQALANPLAAILVQSNCLTICNTVRADVRGNIVPSATDVTDLLTTYIELVESSTSTLELVDTTSPISGTCASELSATNTGSSGVLGGCALIAGPITVP